MKAFFLAAAIFGTLLPWSTFLPSLMDQGLNPVIILSALYSSGASAGFSTDFFITCAVFSVFIWSDAPRRRIKGWWMAVPTYFYLRERSASS